MSAYFGPPAAAFVPGGAHIAVYLLPVYGGQLVAFDVEAAQARGRWLPWDILPWGGNPYELASELADLWCQAPLSDLTLADVMSFPSPEDGWELAVVFRAELSEPARGDEVRKPYFFPPGQFDAIGPFDPIDLERWVTGAVINHREAGPALASGPGSSELDPPAEGEDDANADTADEGPSPLVF